MKTISCNLTKACRILQLAQNHNVRIRGILPEKSHEILPVYRRIIRSSISLVYVRGIEFVSIIT